MREDQSLLAHRAVKDPQLAGGGLLGHGIEDWYPVRIFLAQTRSGTLSIPSSPLRAMRVDRVFEGSNARRGQAG